MDLSYLSKYLYDKARTLLDQKPGSKDLKAVASILDIEEQFILSECESYLSEKEVENLLKAHESIVSVIQEAIKAKTKAKQTLATSLAKDYFSKQVEFLLPKMRARIGTEDREEIGSVLVDFMEGDAFFKDLAQPN